MLPISEQLGLDAAWAMNTINAVVDTIGHWPELDEKTAVDFFKKHYQDINRCQNFIESHLWPNGVPGSVELHLIPLPPMIGGRVWRDPFTGVVHVEVNEMHANHPPYFLSVLAHEYGHVYHHFHAPELISNAQTSHEALCRYECLTDINTIAFGMGNIYLNHRRLNLGKHYLQAGYVNDELLIAGMRAYEQRLQRTTKPRPTPQVAPVPATTFTYTPPAPTGTVSSSPTFFRPAIPSPPLLDKSLRQHAKPSPTLRPTTLRDNQPSVKGQTNPPPQSSRARVKPSPPLRPSRKHGNE